MKYDKELQKPIPTSAIKKLKKGGTELDYVDNFFVIDELNRIFGCTGWSHTVEKLDIVDDATSGKRSVLTVSCLGRLTVYLEDRVLEMTDVGVGTNTANGRGLAYDTAAKSAATDALKRCARLLGRRMGLALYDKEREHVIPLDIEVQDATSLEELEALKPAVLANISKELSDLYKQRKKELTK